MEHGNNPLVEIEFVRYALSILSGVRGRLRFSSGRIVGRKPCRQGFSPSGQPEPSRRHASRFAGLLLLLLCPVWLRADEKSKPEIKGSSLLLLTPGQKITATLYGENLAPKEITVSKPLLQAKLLGVKATEGDARSRGSKQVSVELTAAANCAPDTYEITLVHPDGAKVSVPVAVIAAVNALQVKKPADTFANAMHLTGDSVAVTGTVENDKFTTFAFEARAGETWNITLFAGRLGSELDAMIRLRDSKHLSLALAAGHPKKDRQIHFMAPANGTYYLELSDAEGKGGSTFAYQLLLQKSHGPTP